MTATANIAECTIQNGEPMCWTGGSAEVTIIYSNADEDYSLKSKSPESDTIPDYRHNRIIWRPHNNLTFDNGTGISIGSSSETQISLQAHESFSFFAWFLGVLCGVVLAQLARYIIRHLRHRLAARRTAIMPPDRFMLEASKDEVILEADRILAMLDTMLEKQEAR